MPIASNVRDISRDQLRETGINVPIASSKKTFIPHQRKPPAIAPEQPATIKRIDRRCFLRPYRSVACQMRVTGIPEATRTHVFTKLSETPVTVRSRTNATVASAPQPKLCRIQNRRPGAMYFWEVSTSQPGRFSESCTNPICKFSDFKERASGWTVLRKHSPGV